ncbi:NAD(P)/FAD-dependent oxidoreductase [Hwanghaeella sp.]|uniref:NAD(P)/FAD-dependent oxidoreductase n=1 Tax=Hwanghaeella sp. TaxID=2605943 RepID=UPI003CCBB9E8
MSTETAATAPIETDAVIIGAGPVGLFAIFQLGMLGIKAHVVDALDEAGGQCTALYPEKPIYDIPGFPRIDAGDLITNLEEQAAPFHPVYHLGQQVSAIAGDAEAGFTVTTSKGTTIACKVILIAAGGGAFGPNRPPLDRLAEFEGKSVFYLVKRREDFRGRRIVIGGGGDSAVDWAVSLAPIAEKVYVVHRRDKFRAAPESVRQLHELAGTGAIDLVTPFQLAGLEGEKGQLAAVHVKDLDGRERSLEADRLLPFYGLANTLGPIADWDLDLHKHQIAVERSTCETNRPGIYAIGDIADYPGKLKLILQGFSDAAGAAHHAYGRVFPDQALHFEHSTTKGVTQL